MLLLTCSPHSFAAQEIILGDYIQTEPQIQGQDPVTPAVSEQANPVITTKPDSNEIQLDSEPKFDEDWLWLKSGEFLIGTIEDLYDDKLAFKSDDLGSLRISWGDISRIHSRQLFTIRTAQNKVITGVVSLDRGVLTIRNNREHRIPQAELLTLIAGVENGVNIWDGKIVFGANLSAGNTDKLEYNARVLINRQTTTSRIKADYNVMIAETDNIQTDDNHRFLLTYDVYNDKKLFFRPIDLSFFRDPLQNVSSRINLGMGLGYQFIDTKKQELSLNLGPSYLYSEYEQPDEDLNTSDSSLAVSLTTNYEREIHDKIDFDLSYKITATESSLGGMLHNAQFNFDIELTDILDFDISFYWDQVDKPLSDINGDPLQRNDFRIAFGLGVSFN